ncbi:MAG: hypothetical protein A3F13_00155 [Gammaproteobacteria bacterium RIFCSPHIGHO2_12_FULL_40_19]|nr:MAG: hypothetical protein A3F13_00155 [Gammaproteobacteria bacterium RIFCSPHIGHO2_12_FULL_40_19]
MQNAVILIPAYNEVTTIQAIVDRCLSYSPDVMVIDDGSTDGTLEKLKNMPTVVFSNPVNLGKGATLLKGFQTAIEKNMRGVITLDADGQHNPDDLPQFLSLSAKFPEGFIIGARRTVTNRPPKVRWWANQVADFFISCAARKRLCDTQSGYRYYPVSFLKRYLSGTKTPNRFAFEAEILVAAVLSGLSVHYVDIASCYPAGARASHYHPGKDTWEITKTVAKLIFKKSNGIQSSR